MVRITGYSLRQNAEGKDFYALILQGGLEIIQSANGSSYMTAKKCSLPSTFDEATCAAMIGSELPGTVKKIEGVDPYEYTVPSTGEVLFLTHRYEYVPDEEPAQQDIARLHKYSSNGAGHVEMV